MGVTGSSVEEESQSGDNIWQYREGGSATTKSADPPGSPRAHKAPPPVKPKPSRPAPPNKNSVGSDLMATIQAAQAARSHRPPLGSASSLENLVDEEKKVTGTGVDSDTFL